MDYLVRGRFVLTMREGLGADGIIKDGAIYVSGKNIVEVGLFKDLKAQYSTATIVGSPRFWITPGFVNAHQHGKGMTSFQLGALDEPLVLTRDLSDQIRCLSNVCTHRGTVVVEGAGHEQQLRCRYHGRRFTLDGRFHSMPEFEGATNFPSPADDLPQVGLGDRKSVV